MKIICSEGETLELKGERTSAVHIVGKGGSLTLHGEYCRGTDKAPKLKVSGYFSWLDLPMYVYNVDFSGLRGIDVFSICGFGDDELASCILPKPTLRMNKAKTHYIGYKKLRDSVILRLEIPVNAKIVYGQSDWHTFKQRCSEAVAVAIVSNPYGVRKDELWSQYDCNFKYTLGATVKPDRFDPDPYSTCTNGIHFFHTLKLAKDY